MKKLIRDKIIDIFIYFFNLFEKEKTLSFPFQIMKIATSLKNYVRMYSTIREEEICH